MSSSSPREASATESARTQAALSERLSGIALPQLRQALDLISGELGNGGEPSSIRSLFSNARGELNTQYGSALSGGTAAISQQALQSGSPDAWRSQGAMKDLGLSLERDRAQAMRVLNAQEAQAGMQQYNQLLSQLGQGVGTGLNLANGAYGAQAGAISGMSGRSPLGSTLGGAAGGAATGATFGPWGAVAGGIIGGGLGYLGST